MTVHPRIADVSLAGLLAILLVTLSGGAAVAGRSSSAETEPKPRAGATGAKLILISIDTLRADRLGCYGYTRPTTPAIDAFAARGARFETVVAESSWTLPSHMSLFTGLHPGNHGVRKARNRLTPEITTLAEVLRGHGYRTFAYTAGRFLEDRYGFDQGFEVYDDTVKDFPSALKLARRPVEWFRGKDEPYFLFVHTYDVHCPYEPEEPYATRFRTTGPEGEVETAGKCGNPDYNEMKLTSAQIRFLSDRYDAGIREADDHLAAFLRFLDAGEAWSDTVVVLLSDHGEEFGEHGQIGHERTMYVESLLVPWIIVAPGVEPRVVRGQAGLIDVMPTLLDLLGLPSHPVDGRSHARRLTGEGRPTSRPRVSFSEVDRHVRLRGAFQSRYHYILNRDTGAAELYDLDEDPGEQRNRLDDLKTVAEGLSKAIDRHEQALAPPETGEEVPLTAEEIEKLRSLGYVD